MGGDIILPWPNKALSPNFRSGSHWARTMATKTARTAAWATALEAGWNLAPIPSHGSIAITFTFRPPDRRSRDDDNLVASLKAYRDGLSDALKVNDSRFVPTYHFREPVKDGCVIVSIIGEVI